MKRLPSYYNFQIDLRFRRFRMMLGRVVLEDIAFDSRLGQRILRSYLKLGKRLKTELK